MNLNQDLIEKIRELIPLLENFTTYDYEGLCAKSAQIFKTIIGNIEAQKRMDSHSKKIPKNVTSIGNGFYIIRTQAGFKSLCKQLHDMVGKDAPIEGYPKSYPCVVTIGVFYRGYHYIEANCIHINTLTKAIVDSEIGDIL